MGSFEITQSQFRDSWVKGLAAPPITFDHDGHNFAATVSALDLQNQGYGLVNNWQSDDMFFNVDDEVVNVGQVNGNNLINPALSPFLAVITSTTETPWFGWNYYHNTDISAQFATFIERNILNAQPVNCAGTNGLCGRNPSVSGPAVVCTTAEFLINDLPNGVVIIWTSVNGRFRVIGGQGTPNVTIERISGGSDILRLEITNACGATRTINTDVFLGVPAQPGTIREVLVDYYMGKIQVEIDPVSGATSYNWYKNGVLQTTSHGTFAQISITRRVCDVGYGIEVEAVNACGASPKRYKWVYVPCDYYYTVSPNPAGNTVTVSANESKETRSTSNENVAFDEVRIYDAYGNLKKLQKFNNVKAATINITALSNGTYFIEIGNESFAERQQLFIHK